MNVKTGAWCKFTGINAQCWSPFGDALMYGGIDGNVYRYGGTNDDNGESITAKSRSAFSSVGIPNTKQFVMARPNMMAPEGLIPGVAVSTDYDMTPPAVVSTPYAITETGGLWDTFLWDTTDWAGDLATVLVKDWQTVNGVGQVASVATEVTVSSEVEFNSVDLMYEVGGYL